MTADRITPASHFALLICPRCGTSIVEVPGVPSAPLLKSHTKSCPGKGTPYVVARMKPKGEEATPLEAKKFTEELTDALRKRALRELWKVLK